MSKLVCKYFWLFLFLLLKLLLDTFIRTHSDSLFCSNQLLLLHLSCTSLLQDWIFYLTISFNKEWLVAVVLEKFYDFNTQIFYLGATQVLVISVSSVYELKDWPTHTVHYLAEDWFSFYLRRKKLHADIKELQDGLKSILWCFNIEHHSSANITYFTEYLVDLSSHSKKCLHHEDEILYKLRAHVLWLDWFIEAVDHIESEISELFRYIKSKHGSKVALELKLTCKYVS